MEGSHPLLSQIPLTSTLFPPRPTRLSYNYVPLPPSLPQTQVTEASLQAWIKECDEVKHCLQSFGQREVQSYRQWEKDVVKMAPGYMDHGMLTPQKRTGGELDKQFQNLDLK